MDILKKIWNAFVYKIVLYFLSASVIALFVFLGTGLVSTLGYGRILYCSGCGHNYTSVPWQGYCTSCGTKHSGDDKVDRNPYCMDCGKLEGFDHKTYCAKCGGLIEHNAKVKLSEIKNPVVRFFVKCGL